MARNYEMEVALYREKLKLSLEWRVEDLQHHIGNLEAIKVDCQNLGRGAEYIYLAQCRVRAAIAALQQAMDVLDAAPCEGGEA